MKCENLERCPFYNDKMPMEHGIGSIFKVKYCMGNQNLCARYQVYCKLGESFVPANLYPNMCDVAQEIIRKANSE